jgi:hypothetical protein
VATILRRKARAFRPTKAAAVKADKRPLFEGGSIQRIEGRLFLVTTDTHVCLRLPISPSKNGEEIPEGFVPAAAIPWMERYPFEATEDAIIVGRARSRHVGGEEWVDGEPLMTFARIEPGKASDEQRVYPDVEERWPLNSKRPFRIHLDSKLVRRLAEGLATDALTLEIDLDLVEHFPEENPVGGYKGPISAWRYGHDRHEGAAEGILMPMREPIELKKSEREEQ